MVYDMCMQEYIREVKQHVKQGMWLTWRNIEGPKAHRTGLDSERVVGVRVVRGAGLCHCHGYKECTGCYVNAFKAYNSMWCGIHKACRNRATLVSFVNLSNVWLTSWYLFKTVAACYP